MFIKTVLLVLAPLLLSSAQLSKQALLHKQQNGQLYNLKNAGTHLENEKLAPYTFKNKKELTTYIKKVAKHYKLSSKLLLQIVAVESNYCRYRVNSKSQDFGCFQINRSTIKLHKWSFNAVVNNDMANTIAAAIILSDFKRAFAGREPATFACRYNIGYRNLTKACNAYLAKLEAAR